MTTLARRTLLRGTLPGAAVAIALPALEVMTNQRGAAIAAGPIPRRFGIFWWGNGVRLSHWIPNGEGAAWAPKEELAPFAPWKEYVSVITGMACPVRSGTAHHFGRAQMLTGTDQRAGMYGGSLSPSVDQLVAKHNDGKTRFRSLELMVSRRGFENYRANGQVAQAGNGSFLPSESSPQAMFDRLFGGAARPATSDGAAKVRAARQSVLDSIRADARRLDARLGAADRRRLSDHLEGIRAIESRLQGGLAMVACAAPPPRPTVVPATDLGREDLEAVSNVMSDLLVMALACDLTRAFSFSFTQAQSDTVFWQTGLDEGLHTVSHRASSDDECHRTVVFTMQRLAYLIGRLKATQDGAGNLLDSLCLYGTSEVAEGRSHSVVDVPMLLIGRAGGALRGGIHYRSKTQENTNKALLTMLKAVQVPVTSLGSGSGQTSDTLSALLT